jgi:hypothetical protein
LEAWREVRTHLERIFVWPSSLCLE